MFREETNIIPLWKGNVVLREHHYLGSARRGICWQDEYGVMVLASPTSRWIPSHWIEISRWCLLGEKNAGSKQWAAVRRWIYTNKPLCTTAISYSDPSAGHTGALYRACGWLWAPTWHRLVPPPTGNGNWGTKPQAPKDRWVYHLRKDEKRTNVLKLDETYRRRFPAACYPNARWKEVYG
jgi:hypothetical protein